jgi:hypothetical protein
MILLTKTEETLLMQFHERRGDRTGAHLGDALTLADFRETEAKTQGLEFDGSLDSLVAHHLVRPEGDQYILTQDGYNYLYTREGQRLDEG